MQTVQDFFAPALPERTLPAALQAGLSLLLEAHRFAIELDQDPWNFSVSLATLQGAGLTDTHLRWLLCRDHLRHALETTRPRSERRTFTPVSNLKLYPESCFILTSQGLNLALLLAQPDSLPLWALLHTLPTGLQSPAALQCLLPIPRWRADLQELRLGCYLIKRFRRPAENQMAVLAAFENAGWPPRIANPLDTDLHGDAIERLHDAIKRLNQGRHTPLLRFRGDGTGMGVTWEICPTSAPG